MQAAGTNGWGEALLGAFELTPKLLWPTLAFVGALLFAAAVIALMDRWRKRPPSEILSADNQLTHFRELYERGEISKAEFERIRARLAGEIRRGVGPKPDGGPVRHVEPIDPNDAAGPEPPPPDAPRDGIRPA